MQIALHIDNINFYVNVVDANYYALNVYFEYYCHINLDI